MIYTYTTTNAPFFIKHVITVTPPHPNTDLPSCLLGFLPFFLHSFLTVSLGLLLHCLPSSLTVFGFLPSLPFYLPNCLYWCPSFLASFLASFPPSFFPKFFSGSFPPPGGRQQLVINLRPSPPSPPLPQF